MAQFYLLLTSLSETTFHLFVCLVSSEVTSRTLTLYRAESSEVDTKSGPSQVQSHRSTVLDWLQIVFCRCLLAQGLSPHSRLLWVLERFVSMSLLHLRAKQAYLGRSTLAFVFAATCWRQKIWSPQSMLLRGALSQGNKGESHRVGHPKSFPSFCRLSH